MSDVWACVQPLSQDPDERPDGLQITAKILASDRILAHEDKDIRLLAACCLVDVLRIFAPEAPFEDEEMIRVFEVLIHQLRGLATNDLGSGTGIKIYFILNSLSSVKSCVVPVILMENGVAGARELVITMFDVLISSIRTEHSEEGWL